MPIKKEDYPPNWDQISKDIRTRAGQICEWCGVPNGAHIIRTAPLHYHMVTIAGVKKKVPREDYAFVQGPEGTRIILTVAHLDRDRTNNAPENLAALCQRCHLNHDRQAQHIPNRKYGRNHDREHQKKLDL